MEVSGQIHFPVTLPTRKKSWQPLNRRVTELQRLGELQILSKWSSVNSNICLVGNRSRFLGRSAVQAPEVFRAENWRADQLTSVLAFFFFFERFLSGCSV